MSHFQNSFHKEIFEIIKKLYLDGLEGIETDSFIIKFTKPERNTRFQPDWKKVISDFLKQEEVRRLDVSVFIKLFGREYSLLRLNDCLLRKLYMELLAELDESEDYEVFVDPNKILCNFKPLRVNRN
ncbi:MAG: hypothetical protein ACTSQE_13835 [Candidatus Heimdallarchaeaceae archaeon]